MRGTRSRRATSDGRLRQQVIHGFSCRCHAGSGDRRPLPFDSHGRGDGARVSTRRVPPAGLCVLAKDDGHVMLGKDYIKTVERGVEVSRTELSTEKEWREALEANFGITL